MKLKNLFIIGMVFASRLSANAVSVWLDGQEQSTSSSGGMTSITNGQVQATNVANNSIGPVQTTAQIMYVTNSATYSTTVPPATGIWYNIGSVGAGTVGTRTYSVNYYDGSGSPAWVRFSVYRTNPSGGAMGIGDIVSYSVSSNGFGAVGVDGSQQVFVQITNSSHNTLSPSVLITGFSPDAPDANFTLAFTTSSIASVGYKHYMTPSTNRSIVRATMGDFDYLTVGGSSVAAGGAGGGGTLVGGTLGGVPLSYNEPNWIKVGELTGNDVPYEFMVKLNNTGGFNAVRSTLHFLAVHSTTVGGGNEATRFTVLENENVNSVNFNAVGHAGYTNIYVQVSPDNMGGSTNDGTVVSVAARSLDTNASPVVSVSYAHTGPSTVVSNLQLVGAYFPNGLNATSIKVNGSNVMTLAGGGAYAYQGTNNIAPTNANGNTINAAAIATIISGGASNTIGTAANAAILSGKNNVISNQGTAYSCAVIAGGSGNIIGGDPSEPGWWGVVAGGRNNVMNGDRSNIGGGEGNRVADQVFYSAIVGGFNNTALAGYSVIGGESCNNTTLGAYSAIFGQANQSAGGWNSMPGGANNTCYAPGDYCVVSGGRNNNTIADYAVCGGGRDNEVRAEYSVVNGGYLNVIDDSASYANIAGGLSCKVSNSATYAMAAGRRAKAGHSGAFVWADSTDADFGSTAANQFLIRASGGVGINTNAPGTYALSVNGTIAGLPTFVSMGMPNGLVLAVSTALAPVTNFNSISSVGFGTNLVAGTCTIPMDGYYQINHGMSAMSGGAAKDFQIVMTSNGTAIAGTRLVFTTANATYEVGRGLFNLWLTNGTIIGQSAAVLSGTDTLTFTNVSININRLN